jgi:Transposase (partial DDE domain)
MKKTRLGFTCNNTPETKNQSQQWIVSEILALKKAITAKSAGKVITSVFWDPKVILLLDYW